jgi:hypothetical protein
MWHYNAQDFLIAEHGVTPITDENIMSSAFIMLGRWTRDTEVDIKEILRDFDRLLPLYAD